MTFFPAGSFGVLPVPGWVSAATLVSSQAKNMHVSLTGDSGPVSE